MKGVTTMASNTRINKSNQEETMMRKLIVEAPELKEGQTDSSGGIRENGKMSVQYKNPVPYVEPKLLPAVPQKSHIRKNLLKDQAKDFALDVGTDIISMLWYEFGHPLLQAKLHQLGQIAVAYLNTPAKTTQTFPKDYSQDKGIIDAKFVEIQEADDSAYNNNIIRFPREHVS